MTETSKEKVDVEQLVDEILNPLRTSLRTAIKRVLASQPTSLPDAIVKMKMAVSVAVLRCDSDATLPRVRSIVVAPVLLELFPLEFLNEIYLDQVHILEVLSEAGLGVFVSGDKLLDLAFSRNLARGGDGFTAGTYRNYLCWLRKKLPEIGFTLSNNGCNGSGRSYALTRIPPSSQL